MKKYYIIYEVVRNEEGQVLDIINKYDNENTSKIAEWLQVDYKNINKYTIKELKEITNEDTNQTYLDINCKLKENKYFIFKDYEK